MKTTSYVQSLRALPITDAGLRAMQDILGDIVEKRKSGQLTHSEMRAVSRECDRILRDHRSRLLEVHVDVWRKTRARLSAQ